MEAKALEIVRAGFDAINRGDLEAMIALTAPDVEFRPLGATRVEGRAFRGHEGLRAWHAERASTWSLAYTLHELTQVSPARVIVHGELHSRGATSGLELDTRASWVVELRGGSVVRIEAFLDRAEAEAAAAAPSP